MRKHLSLMARLKRGIAYSRRNVGNRSRRRVIFISHSRRLDLLSSQGVIPAYPFPLLRSRDISPTSLSYRNAHLFILPFYFLFSLLFLLLLLIMIFIRLLIKFPVPRYVTFNWWCIRSEKMYSKYSYKTC